MVTKKVEDYKWHIVIALQSEETRTVSVEHYCSEWQSKLWNSWQNYGCDTPLEYCKCVSSQLKHNNSHVNYSTETNNSSVSLFILSRPNPTRMFYSSEIPQSFMCLKRSVIQLWSLFKIIWDWVYWLVEWSDTFHHINAWILLINCQITLNEWDCQSSEIITWTPVCWLAHVLIDFIMKCTDSMHMYCGSLIVLRSGLRTKISISCVFKCTTWSTVCLLVFSIRDCEWGDVAFVYVCVCQY